MASRPLHTVVRQLRRLLGAETGSTLNDADLLREFIDRHDEAAFEVLVWRHGAMVFNLCQRILRDSHDAEDAFQATFLVFARKAGAIDKRESVASWLYKVAYRVALRARAKAARPNAVALADEPPAPAANDADWSELRPILDAEIDRLPEKYRAPFLLCYLQGHTNEEAAEQLGCPKGTVLSRLARGRERLRTRLVQRGVVLSGAGLIVALSQNAASASVPASLVASTGKAAMVFAAGHAAGEFVSTSVAALAHGVLRTMFLQKLKIAGVVVLSLAALGTGTLVSWTAAREPAGEREAPARRAAEPVAQRGERTPVPEEQLLSGRVVGVAKDGKSITIETPGKGRGEEPTKTTVQLGDKTAVTYQDVGNDGATPTEGYGVRIQFSDAARQVATSVVFQGAPSSRRGADLGGKIMAIAKNGKSITLEPRDARGGRGEAPPRVEIRFDDKTVLLLSAVKKDGAKLAEGQFASVMLLDGSKDVAGSVHVMGGEVGERGERGDRTRPDLAGKIAEVGKDSKTITIETPAAARGEEPMKTVITLGDAPVTFQNVGVGGARLDAGMNAMIWLKDGSKDTAARAAVLGTVADRWTTLRGLVVAVSKDGSTITLEEPIRARGEEAKRTDIKINVNTRVRFHGVGTGEAKIAEGHAAQVRLLDGSNDTAAEIHFSKPGAGRR